jgi:hypothetical protein
MHPPGETVNNQVTGKTCKGIDNEICNSAILFLQALMRLPQQKM